MFVLSHSRLKTDREYKGIHLLTENNFIPSAFYDYNTSRVSTVNGIPIAMTEKKFDLRQKINQLKSESESEITSRKRRQPDAGDEICIGDKRSKQNTEHGLADNRPVVRRVVINRVVVVREPSRFETENPIGHRQRMKVRNSHPPRKSSFLPQKAMDFVDGEGELFKQQFGRPGQWVDETHGKFLINSHKKLLETLTFLTKSQMQTTEEFHKAKLKCCAKKGLPSKKSNANRHGYIRQYPYQLPLHLLKIFHPQIYYKQVALSTKYQNQTYRPTYHYQTSPANCRPSVIVNCRSPAAGNCRRIY